MFSIKVTLDNSKDNVENQKITGLIEEVISDLNLDIAIERVIANKGSHGVDNMTVNELSEYFRKHKCEILQQIRERRYMPKPVRRVEIPKPDGGVRLLGIPTVVDRVIQQAIHQVLVPIYEKKFSNNSYGFRRSRSAKLAINKCKEYIEQEYTWVVDIDLEKYFDTVNHDKLMRIIHSTIDDGDLLCLIRRFLQSGVEIDGVFHKTEKGCPQGGPLSPTLSNIMLNELDTELEKRKLKFCRYADDCNIYVKTKRAAERVMKSITIFIEEKLKLKVNQLKSKVDRPWKVKFLGFSFYTTKEGKIRIRVHQKAVDKIKTKLKELTKRSWSIGMESRIMKINQSTLGWINYFAIADMVGVISKLDGWLRRRIRMCYWKQWKKIKTKFRKLKELGIEKGKAKEFANTRKGYWRTAGSPILSRTITNKFLNDSGLKSMIEMYSLKH